MNMKQLAYTDIIAEATDKMTRDGIFLTVAGGAPGEPPNTMTIGWGAVGFYWGKPMFTVVVRPQRHTFDMLKSAGEFTVSVPTANPLKQELTFAGTKSGRDYNKFEGHGLTAAPAQKVGAPIVKECGLHFECKIRLRQDMTGERMDQAVIDWTYSRGDFHTMCFGEIVACYSTDE